MDGGAGTDRLNLEAYTYGVAVKLGESKFTDGSMVYEHDFANHVSRHSMMKVTAANVETFKGSEFDDVVLSHDTLDIIRLGRGNDIAYGSNGNDIIKGQNGNDTIIGGFGNDILDGGGGNDELYGGHGDDTLNGGRGDDTLSGEFGKDTLTGGGGADTFKILYPSASEWDHAAPDVITDFSGHGGQGDRIIVGLSWANRSADATYDPVWFRQMDFDGDGDTDTVIYNNAAGQGGIYAVLLDHDQALTEDDFLYAGTVTEIA